MNVGMRVVMMMVVIVRMIMIVCGAVGPFVRRFQILLLWHWDDGPFAKRMVHNTDGSSCLLRVHILDSGQFHESLETIYIVLVQCSQELFKLFQTEVRIVGTLFISKALDFHGVQLILVVSFVAVLIQ